MTTLREIRIDKPSLRDLAVGDSLFLPRRTYRVTGLASGGMGTVILGALDRSGDYAAFSALPEPIALKYAHDPERFLQTELNKWALLQHEKINPLCEILSSERDGLVAASQQCSGSVRQLLSRHGRLSVRCAYSVVRSCAEGLAFADRTHGVLHLDVKPENILYQERGTAPEEFLFCLTDWGISSERTRGRNEQAGEKSLPSPNNAGTLPYMAPERFLPRSAASSQSDIYALGMAWLELLAGRLPYTAGTPLVEQILSGRFYPLADSMLRQQGVPRKMSNLIRRSIHPLPDRRIQSWNEFLRSIRPRFVTRFFS
jgi:serine/threonine-protein kinase